MAAELSSTFRLTDGKIVFDRMDLITDGAVSQLSGVINPALWPEQLYQVKSRMQFPRMREIFFANDQFSLSGEGLFAGTFHMFKGGRELKGDFSSAEAGVNDFRFPNLSGSVVWVRDRMEVTRATAGVPRRHGPLPLRHVAARQRRDTGAGAIRRRVQRGRSQRVVGLL